jgi:competence protein ComEA
VDDVSEHDAAGRSGQVPHLDRPLPPRRPAEAVAEWVALIGVARMAVAGASALAVALAAAWLLRAGPPATEASLALATAGEPSVTLALPPTETAVIVVHVAGAVRSPGVHRLADGDRVIDAIAAAGGELPGADVQVLNLAAPVVDGQRIHVPVEGEEPEADPAAQSGVPTGPIDINRATAEQLESLPGIGPATAAAIIDDRSTNGPFATVDDLDRVSGIGPATLARLRDRVTAR